MCQKPINCSCLHRSLLNPYILLSNPLFRYLVLPIVSSIVQIIHNVAVKIPLNKVASNSVNVLDKIRLLLSLNFGQKQIRHKIEKNHITKMKPRKSKIFHLVEDASSIINCYSDIYNLISLLKTAVNKFFNASSTQ